MELIDLQSLMGYANGSPFNNAPFLDIRTPEGLITMENTPIDLMGIDNLGNVKKMKAKSKNPYKFKGNVVREIPLQKGGKPPVIYTLNPNDPRLQMYRDSLALYNASIYENSLIEKEKRGLKTTDAEWKKNDQMTERGEIAFNRLSEINGIEPSVRSFKSKSYQDTDGSIVHRGANEFYPPVQKVVFGRKPEPVRQPNMKGRPNTIIPTETIDINRTTIEPPNIQPRPAVTMPDYNTPTKFSITYPLDEYNQQKTMYFQDKDAWRQALKALKGRSSQEGSDYATATGYLRKGGNPYQMGGITNTQMFDFLFDDEEVEVPKGQNPPPTAPTTDEVDIQNQLDQLNFERQQLESQANDNLAMSVLMDQRVTKRGNPYTVAQQPQQMPNGNPYTGEILSSGQFGNQNVGNYGRQIYGQLATDLGYAPTVNSIFRSKAQNDSLIAAGKPAAKNSWHLTGNAIDLKPADWHKLSNEQQLYYRQNYDVVYHDNHYHIEPK